MSMTNKPQQGTIETVPTEKQVKRKCDPIKSELDHIQFIREANRKESSRLFHKQWKTLRGQ